MSAFVNKQSFINDDIRNLKEGDLIQLSVDILIIKVYNLRLSEQYRRIIKQASEFIQYINDEYHLKDE
jgi:ASC-1-like (ASCH) protein